LNIRQSCRPSTGEVHIALELATRLKSTMEISEKAENLERLKDQSSNRDVSQASKKGKEGDFARDTTVEIDQPSGQSPDSSDREKEERDKTKKKKENGTYGYYAVRMTT
jgi:hypothetical protein